MTAFNRPDPSPWLFLAGAIMYAIAIRARIGMKAAELRAFANSMVPVICR